MVVFLFLSLRNTDGTVIQGANSQSASVVNETHHLGDCTQCLGVFNCPDCGKGLWPQIQRPEHHWAALEATYQHRSKANYTGEGSKKSLLGGSRAASRDQTNRHPT